MAFPLANEALRALIVENQNAFASTIVEELQRAGFQVDWHQVGAESEFLEALDPLPDLIFSDYALPRFGALRVVDLLEERQLDIPVIVVSEAADVATAIEAVKRGAADFLLIDALDRLGPVVKRALEERRVRRAKRDAEAGLRESELRLRTVFNTEPACVKLVGANGELLDMNEAGLAFLELETLAEAQKCPLDEWIAPAFRDRFAALHRQVMAGESGVLEFEIIGAKGTRRILETNAAPLRNEEGEIVAFVGVTRDVTEHHRIVQSRKKAEEAVGKGDSLLAAISDVQTRFMVEADPRGSFDLMLATLLDATESAYGFIGEAFRKPDGQPFLKTHAITNIAWNEETRNLYENRALEGMEFFNLDTLFGSVLTTENPVFANDPARDPRSGGVPPGHPELRSFLGLPFFYRGELVGMVGLANRSGGYDESILKQVEPLTSTCASLIEALRLERRRRQVEEKIRKSESRLAETQRVAGLGSWDLDLATGAIEWSDETYRIFGLAPQSFVPNREDFYGCVYPADLDCVRSAVEETLATGRSYQIEHRIARPDGTIRFVKENAELVKDAQDEPTRLVGTVLDITALKEAELALQRSEQLFRSLIEHAQDLIALVDIEGELLFLSPSLPQLLGYEPEQLLKASVFDFIHPEDTASVREALGRALAEKSRPTPVEFRIRHADGTWRTMESIGKKLENDDARIVIVVNSRDISERKRLEEQLRQSQKMEAIGQLAGGVAHDFNNLLTIIHGYASFLITPRNLGELETRAVREIELAAKRATDLTRQLLLFGRKQVIRLRDLDLNDVVTNMVKMLHRVLGENIKLQMELGASLPLVKADVGMMEQVLLNLGINSRDAMPNGGRLVVRTHAEENEEDPGQQSTELLRSLRICLTVTDTGWGIAPEHLPRIFEPFFTTKEVGKGTGLGLATVHGIIQQHQGSVHVESQVGQGTTVRVCLPAVLTKSTPELSGEAPEVVTGGNETILLVEDEPEVRGLARLALERYGYRVLEAADGPEAVQVWKDHQDTIQLLMTDMIMPGGMTGRDLADRLQSEAKDLKVIYASGYSADGLGAGMVWADEDIFIQKPFRPHELGKAVREALDSKPRRRS